METEPTTKHVLQGRELIDYLVEKASTTTNAELVEREDRRNRRSTVLFSLVTFVGISGLIGAARLFIDNAVQERTKEFSAEMKRNSAELGDRISAMNLQTQAMQKLLNDQMNTLSQGIEQKVKLQVAEEASRGLLLLKNRERFHSLKQFVTEIKGEVAEHRFPENLLTAAIDTVNALANAHEITSEHEYSNMIETLVHQLVLYDRVKDINRVEEATRDTCLQSKAISLDLTDHFGQLIVSSPYPVEQMPHEFESLTRYARASRELKYPERSLMWELFVEFKRAKYSRSATTDEILAMVNSLEAVDLRNFGHYVFMYSDPLYWEHTPDHEGRTLAKLVGSLLEAYPELRKTVETQIATPELRSTVDQLIAGKAERQQRLDAAARPATPVEEAPQTATTEAESTEDANALRR
jgi:hypothetical protein